MAGARPPPHLRARASAGVDQGPGDGRQLRLQPDGLQPAGDGLVARVARRAAPPGGGLRALPLRQAHQHGDEPEQHGAPRGPGRRGGKTRRVKPCRARRAAAPLRQRRTRAARRPRSRRARLPRSALGGCAGARGLLPRRPASRLSPRAVQDAQVRRQRGHRHHEGGRQRRHGDVHVREQGRAQRGSRVCFRVSDAWPPPSRPGQDQRLRAEADGH